MAAIGLAVGALDGLAATDHAGDSKVDSNTSVTVNDRGGYSHVLCTGSPTEHDCDKSDELDAGPASVDYKGFDDDSLQNRSSRFGDTFVVTVDGEEYTVSFTCDLNDDPPEGNPCPVDPRVTAAATARPTTTPGTTAAGTTARRTTQTTRSRSLLLARLAGRGPPGDTLGSRS